MAKRYYWLKLKADWFSDKRIKKLRSIAGGDTHTIIYLKMMLLSLKDEGKLYFEGVEDNFASEIALALDEDAENVKLTLAFLQRHGLIEIGDREKLEKGKFPKDIGVILDNAGFLPNETGLKNLSIIAGILRKVTKEELEETMRLVGLDPASQVKVGKYSLGMRQRLAIAQALMEKPALLILDEPFNAIDKKTVKDFRELLSQLNTQEGVTILMTSHHQEEIEGLCRNIYRIDLKDLKKVSMTASAERSQRLP